MFEISRFYQSDFLDFSPNITGEYVSRIEKKALKKLNAALED